jgi:5'-3' exonuclease
MVLSFIFIDGSYFIFHRYFSLTNWWSMAKQEEIDERIIENKEFTDKFRTTFKTKVIEISKKLKIPNPIYIVGKDCPREEIWRNELFPEYKQHRVNNSQVGSFFKLAYKEKLFESSGVQQIISYPRLEADDCIAITVRHVQTKYPEAFIYIITSDMDYLQLMNKKTRIFNLAYKEVVIPEGEDNFASKSLFCKTVMGDKSDGIQSIFPKCGPKTALKYYEDKELFNKKLKETPGADEKYETNKKLIDFNYIPSDLREGFLQDVLLL